MTTQFSFIIITYNEEIHLPRLLASIKNLDAPVFVLDSGSTDATVAIAKDFGATVLQHAFENHPKQWDFALKNFDVRTPWVICLDADQVVTPELNSRLSSFNDADYREINGIYFNRKNYFKGRWVRNGGYSPFYLLKMIRFGTGYSDLNENMDHRLIVPGKTVIWKEGFIIEENLKENKISFWIAKHNRYSDLVAQEEVERLMQMRTQTVNPQFWGTPDERTAWLKQLWWRLPRYVRPMLYFMYRIFFQLGILDGRTGVIFHFLQAFWFRLVVDIKIDEILKQEEDTKIPPENNSSPVKFVLVFIALFAVFYYFNIIYFGLTSPGNHYSAFLATHLNYIRGLRWLLLKSTVQVLGLFGYTAISNDYELLVPGHQVLVLVYSCLGLGVMSFFAAFVLAYPIKFKSKIIFLLSGLLGIQILNVTRLVLLALFWSSRENRLIDHHTIFNIILYIIISITLYFWVKRNDGTILNS
ncbi:exosortase Y [Mucilaginibacter flavidus]|uniref:exosortase Y n=1 Tax=Mucilaginibacter flavidus TaxID=2949309 RepID=UPI002092C8D0|nr:glycosyltransferase [Mucilaginibacter flavidus]MCO5947691.1 glycosyltransferase [Mucilaginibacter flavidus]